MTTGEATWPSTVAEQPTVEEIYAENLRLHQQVQALVHRLRQGEERRRAMIHILGDYERDRRRLERSRKAMIHIMGDLRQTTEEVELREQELREKQDQLIQAGKLATLGELTTGIAHELNNPLNNISLYLGNCVDQLRLGITDTERLIGDLQKAERQVQKATEIITHLRSFGRVAVGDRKVIDVNEVIATAISLVEEQLRLNEIRIEVSLPNSPVSIEGNWIQLEQVLVNLLTNARDAVSTSTTKWIRVRCEAAERHARITVADSGAGIPEGFEQRIFDPFVTTKEVGKGTGLGLSITYGIIKEHGGNISALNGDDCGAVFAISLPLADPGGRDHG